MPSIAIPVSLRGQLLNSVRAVTAFSPSTLFALNEPGVWYDPSDVANLAWRRNLLTFTEQFDNAAWGKFQASVTANTSVAPDGTTTADTITASGAFGNTTQNITLISGSTYRVSFYAKAGTSSRSAIGLYDNTGGDFQGRLDFNWASGVPSTHSTSGTVNSPTYTSVGNGWYRISFATVADASNTAHIVYFYADLVAGTGTALIWGAQLELGSVATDYQKITDVNTEVIERFPSATLYQDTAGTQPVTTPGQTVALALDKSKGLVLGSELVTNGTFDTNITGWTAAVGSGTLPTLSLSSNRLRIAANENSQAASAYASITTVVGRTYSFSAQRFTVTPNSSLMTFAASTSTSTSTANFLAQTGTAGNTCVFVATGTTTYIHARISGTIVVGDTWEVDNISVKELPGFHATQATTASRPIYGINPVGGRRNLLTRTEEFGTSPWTNITAGTGVAPTVTADAGNDPNGPLTADRIQFSLSGGTAGGDISRRIQSFTTPAASHVFSVYLRSTDGTSTYNMHIVGSDGLTTNIVVTGAWQRFSVVSTGSGAPVSYAIGLRGGQSPANSNTADVLAWGAQLETGSTATSYQRVSSIYDVTEAGVASVSYLAFDGVDDWLVTPTITPGIDKAQVFAGVRKLSDAAQGLLVESSANSFSNDGSMSLFAPYAGSFYEMFTRGTVAYAWQKQGTYAAPITNVVQASLDNSKLTTATQIVARVNGATPSTVTNQAGPTSAGNFLAYPLYIGRRAGTSLPFNGQLYSLIVRFGTNLTTDTITSTETWVAGQTGIANWANLISPTIFARDETAVLDRFNQTIERRAV